MKWTWENRNYGSDDERAVVVKTTGKSCKDCRFNADCGGKAYVTGTTRYERICTFDPKEKFHYIWDNFVCKAFDWQDGKAPRAKGQKRVIQL